jgi:hypothetical protein
LPTTDERAETRWLVLVYQFPKGPGSQRVKLWRRLQNIGAIAIKHSVYVLPLNEQSQEDFHWLLAELAAAGADGAILESRFVDGMTDQQVRSLFDAARQTDYADLLEEINSNFRSIDAADRLAENTDLDAHRLLVRAKKRLAEIEAIDYFGCVAHDAVDAAIRQLGERIASGPAEPRGGVKTKMSIELKQLRNRTWVTRRGVRIDRIASAWLVRRWIDPDAKFKFVAAKNYEPGERDIRFDMFEGEFTHQGDNCTFEVLIGHARPDDAALRAIAEIVHDIDLKDSKFSRVETQGIASLIAGIVARVDDDERRIERGSVVFDDLYRFFTDLDKQAPV